MLLMRERRNIADNEDDDFRVLDTRQIAETLTGTTRILTMLLGAVAAVSLLVGGIGIMNIMLVSVTERTREIGIRKAIGAKDKDILRQFLIEAMLMSGIGGMLGVAAGAGAAAVIGSVSQFSTLVEVPSVVLALSFSAAVGIFFGYYPARRAARLSPIESLRYE